MHTGLHCSEVGARAQHRVYRHACTCQLSRTQAGEEGRTGTESKRKVSREYVESGRQDSTVPQRNMQPHKTHVGVYVQRDFTQTWVNIQTKMAAFTYTHNLNMDFARP